METILLLTESRAQVRAIDVAHSTGYTKPSVSRAMGLLKKRGHIEVDENGFITLTAEGASIARRVVERHRVLSSFLEQLGVDPAIADDDACKMEHIISDETFERMKDYLSRNGRGHRDQLQVHLL